MEIKEIKKQHKQNCRNQTCLTCILIGLTEAQIRLQSKQDQLQAYEPKPLAYRRNGRINATV
jgi:hypothetical protein